MNRDEKRTRPEGQPPSLRNIAGHGLIYPSEPRGGTWISLNESGVSLALINWYSVTQRVKSDPLSRGEVIPSVGTATAGHSVDAGLDGLPRGRINPFRLLGVFPASQELIEWDWDLKQLVRRTHPWQMQLWASSGFDEPGAQAVRSHAFLRAQREKSAGSLSWVRRLHSSHLPQEGPFSICMHRQDAVTVGYTEICVLGQRARMGYKAGAPCSGSKLPLQVLHGKALGSLPNHPGCRATALGASCPPSGVQIATVRFG